MVAPGPCLPPGAPKAVPVPPRRTARGTRSAEICSGPSLGGVTGAARSAAFKAAMGRPQRLQHRDPISVVLDPSPISSAPSWARARPGRRAEMQGK